MYHYIGITQRDTCIWSYKLILQLLDGNSEFQCASLEKPITVYEHFSESHVTVQLAQDRFLYYQVSSSCYWLKRSSSGLKGILSLRHQSLPLRRFSGHIESWGAGFPRLELSRFQRYANSATCRGLCSARPSTKCKPRRKSIISQCTCSEIKLDRLQDPVSSALVFHGFSQEM